MAVTNAAKAAMILMLGIGVPLVVRWSDSRNLVTVPIADLNECRVTDSTISDSLAMIWSEHNPYSSGMTMELRHLRYFIAVAEEGHITRAAERLGMQQPPLSRQIKAIEREMDVQLFRRKARGVELTDAGRAFLDDARATLVSLDHAFETARRTARGEQGRLCVGYSLFHPVVPRVIREFRQAFPSVSLTLEESSPYDLIEYMQNDKIDVAFISGPIADQERVTMDPLLEEPRVVALPSGHPLARSKNGGDTALSLKSLAAETFIFFGRPNSPLTMAANAFVVACQAAGFSPRIGQIVPNNRSRLNLVAANLGIATIATSFQRNSIEGVVYRRLKSAKQLNVPLNLASRRGDSSAVVAQFRKLAKRTARNFLHRDCSD
jgi:DNA-binding transcriptional LysR family regulator